tara:strand:+ start:6454 stop:6567 length:114 start_codon:yes stop_codon:yes gene_type:complete
MTPLDFIGYYSLEIILWITIFYFIGDSIYELIKKDKK